MNWESILDRITSSVFGLICHQDPTELLYIDGKAVTLCPRCIGLQISFLITIAIVAVLKKFGRRSSITKPALAITIIFALFAPIHWVLCRDGISVPDSTMRLVTGLGSGGAMAILLNAYLAGKTGQIPSERLGLKIIPALAILVIAETTGSALVSLTNWLVLTLVTFICVLGNSLIAAHTLWIIVLGILGSKSKTIADGG